MASTVAGELAINGFRNRDLRTRLPGTTTPQISRCLKRLRLHGIIKKQPGTFKYYPTTLGRRIVVGALALKEMTVTPAIAHSGTGGSSDT